MRRDYEARADPKKQERGGASPEKAEERIRMDRADATRVRICLDSANTLKDMVYIVQST